jgi:hypothetical protein
LSRALSNSSRLAERDAARRTVELLLIGRILWRPSLLQDQ